MAHEQEQAHEIAELRNRAALLESLLAEALHHDLAEAGRPAKLPEGINASDDGGDADSWSKLANLACQVYLGYSIVNMETKSFVTCWAKRLLIVWDLG